MSNGLLIDLVSYWKMEEASGDLYDAHGSNDLTATDLSRDTGIKDYCQSVWSTSANAMIANSTNMGTRTRSVSQWVKLRYASQPGTDAVFFLQQAENDGSWKYVLRRGTQDATLDKFRFWTEHSGGSADAFSSTVPISDNTTWHHIVWMYDNDADSKVCWVDAGKVIDNTPGQGDMNIYADADDTYVPGTNLGQGAVQGYYDEMAWWTRALTQEDVETIYNSGDGLFYDDWDSGATNDKFFLVF